MQPTLDEQNAQVGDAFVDEMWEPVLGTAAATYTITNIVRWEDDPTYVVYEIQFMKGPNGEEIGNKTACSGEARGRKLV